jgi:EAL domain-containing protein (putative c-di-GMP-specific phosphodiesterase class I)
MPCSRCEITAETLVGPATLHIWSPLGHSDGKVGRIAGEAGTPTRRGDGSGALEIDVCEALWPRLRDGLIAGLSRVERAAILVIPAERGSVATLHDVSRLVTLEQYINRLESAWLVRRVAEGDLEVSFQPVAYADAPQEVFASAAVVAASDADGRTSSAAELFDLARDADFLSALDRTARIAAIRGIAEVGVEGPVFVSFAPSAIYDPRFCLRTTLAEADRRGVTPEAVIFSILSADGGADVDHLESVLRFYVENGFRTAMTLSTRREASFEMLQRLKPHVLIIEAGLVEGVRRDPHREVVARKLIEIAHRLQLETVVQGVDTADDCEWAYSQGASYVQGRYVSAMALQPAS